MDMIFVPDTDVANYIGQLHEMAQREDIDFFYIETVVSLENWWKARATAKKGDVTLMKEGDWFRKRQLARSCAARLLLTELQAKLNGVAPGQTTSPRLKVLRQRCATQLDQSYWILQPCVHLEYVRAHGWMACIELRHVNYTTQNYLSHSQGEACDLAANEALAAMDTYSLGTHLAYGSD